MSVATTTSRSCVGSVSESAGIRVAVMPRYLPDQSEPQDRKFVFSYRIRITNNGQASAKLLLRRWLVVDAHGVQNEVRGEGVVGQQPRLEPGQSFEYSSWCPLRTPWGTMEGSYTFASDTGQRTEVPIARFYLVGPEGRGR